MITVNHLDDLVKKAAYLKDQHEQMKHRTAEIWHEYEQAANEIVTLLTQLGRKEYRSGDFAFSFKEVSSYKVPKDAENRELFFNYLREKGIYEDFVTVNSQTLNAFCKQEEAAAEESGNLDFKIPGLIKTTPFLQPTLKKIRR